METSITANNNTSPSIDLRMLANTVRHKTQEKYAGGGRRSKSIAVNNLLTTSHLKQPPGTAMIPNLPLNDLSFNGKQHAHQLFPKSYHHHQRFVQDSMMMSPGGNGLDLKDFIKRNI